MKPSRLLAILAATALLSCGQTTSTKLKEPQTKEILNINAPAVSLQISTYETENKRQYYEASLEITDVNRDLSKYEVYVNGRKLSEKEIQGYTSNINTNSTINKLESELLIQSILARNPKTELDAFGYFKTFYSSDGKSRMQFYGPKIFGDLPFGNNVLTIIAYDEAGNQGKAEVEYNLK